MLLPLCPQLGLLLRRGYGCTNCWMKARSFPRPSEEQKGSVRCRRGPAGLGASSSTWGGTGGSQRGCWGWGRGQSPAVLTPISLKVRSVLSARLWVGRSGGREIPEGAPPDPPAAQQGWGDARHQAPTHPNHPPLLGTAAVPPHRLPLGRGSGVSTRVGGKTPIPPAPGLCSPGGLQQGLGLRGWVLPTCLSFPQSQAGLGWG